MPTKLQVALLRRNGVFGWNEDSGKALSWQPIAKGQPLHNLALTMTLVLLAVGCQKKGGGTEVGQDTPVTYGGSGGGGGVSSRAVGAAPTGFLVAGVTEQSISLSWTDNAVNGLIYDMDSCEGLGCGGFFAIDKSPLPAKTAAFTQTGLKPDTSYRFRLRSTNQNGSSDWLMSSDILTALPPLTGLSVTNVTDTTAVLTWTASSAQVDGYELQACSGSGCTAYKAVIDSPFTGGLTTHTLTGLTSGSVYRLRLRGKTQTNSTVWLVSDDVKTIAQTSAPTGFAVTNLTNQMVQFSWVNNSLNPLYYEVQRCVGVGCTNFAAAPGSPLPATATSYTASDLTSGSVSTYRVRAVGGSSQSPWLAGPPVTGGPLPPTSLVIGVRTSTSVGLSWTNNAPADTGYQIQKCAGSTCTNFTTAPGSPSAAHATSFIVAGLTSMTNYFFRVRTLNGAAVSEWLTSPMSFTMAAAAACTTPKTVIVDRGVKFNTAAVGRGLWSDLKMIPGTTKYAVAYYDGSATGGTATIKASSWNGSKFTVENVAGDSRVAAGSATSVHLAFLSNGQPLIFWTTGALTVKAATRSAAFGTAGTWSAGVIDTAPAGSATRALDVAVNPLDQVVVGYLTNTTTGGRARSIYCTANCAALGSYVTMTAATDTVEATNIIAATNDIGVGWCKNNAASYYPAMVYPGNAGAAIRYSSCNGAITSCKTAAGWSGQATSVVTTTGTVSRLLLDSTVTGDAPKILTRNAGNTLMQVFQMNQACNAAPAYTFTGGSTLGAATSGTAWARLLRDATGLYHVITNLGTANIGYYNSLTSTLATTTWNTIGTVDTLTLPAGGAGSGGADISPTLGQIFASYGGNSAPFNINVGVVGDYTVASSSTSATFYQTVADLTGNVILPTAGGQTRNTSSAATSDGRPAVAYVDSSIGAPAGAALKFAFRSGLNATSPWQRWTIPNTSSPQFPALVFDQNDLPWIAFYDAATFRYNLVTNSSTDGSGDWSFYEFPLNAKVASAAVPATDDIALAMFYNSGTAKPLMIVMNSTAAGGQGVRTALFDPTTQTFSSMANIDALGASFGTRLTADFDATGSIVIAYYDLTVNKVKYNFSIDGQTWLATPLQLTALNTGREGLAIKLDPSSGRPGISYYDRANNIVYYTNCTKSILQCSTLSNWVTTTIASTIGTSTLPALNEQVLNTSLTYSADGQPYVGYLTGNTAAFQNLNLSDKTSGSFVATVLGTSPTSTVAGAAPLHMGMTGLGLSAVRTSQGVWVGSYTGVNNWQYATSCGD